MAIPAQHLPAEQPARPPAAPHRVSSTFKVSQLQPVAYGDAPPLSPEAEIELGRRIAEAHARMQKALIFTQPAAKRLVELQQDAAAGKLDLDNVIIAGAGGDAQFAELCRLAAEYHRIGDRPGARPRETVAKRLAEAAERLELNHDVVQSLVDEHYRRAHGRDAALDAEIAQAQKANRQAQAQLIHSHLRFVAAVARSFRGRGVDFADLVQEGNLGLIRAAEKFDYRMGCRFNTYAMYWIRATIKACISNQARTIRVPTRRLQALARVSRAQRRLANRLGREPTAAEVSSETELAIEEVEDALALPKDAICISALSADDDGDHGFDRIEDRTERGPFHAVADRRLRHDAREMLSTLSPREARVLRLRFGIEERTDHTLEEIGQLFGVTRERIRQIEARALRKLKSAQIQEQPD